MAYSSFEKYGKNTEAERNAFKAEIDKVAKGSTELPRFLVTSISR